MTKFSNKIDIFVYNFELLMVYYVITKYCLKRELTRKNVYLSYFLRDFLREILLEFFETHVNEVKIHD